MKNSTSLNQIMLYSLLTCIAISSCKKVETPELNEEKLGEEWIRVGHVAVGGATHYYDQKVVKKVIKRSEEIPNGMNLWIVTSDTGYPFHAIQHALNIDSLMIPRTYVPHDSAIYHESKNTFSVRMHYSEEPPPFALQHMTPDSARRKTGMYELKRIQGKYVSIFSDISEEGFWGSGPWSRKIISGYVIWEEK